MDYSFNVEVAALHGVNEAIFLHNLYYWICKNEANGRHHIDGKTWTYNSTDALTELFPFWSKDQIKRLIVKMRDNGLIEVGHFNKKGWDRTNWYTLTEEVLEIYERYTIGRNRPMHSAESPNPSGEIAPTIPDNKPDIKPNKKQGQENGLFAPPTLDMISDFCKENSVSIDCHKFLDYYTANGWMAGRVKMKDWKAAARNWRRRQNDFNSTSYSAMNVSDSRNTGTDIKYDLLTKTEYTPMRGKK